MQNIYKCQHVCQFGLLAGIIAEGSGSPAPATMAQTRLHVLDVNEHAPAFHSQPYVVHVAENAPPHTTLVQRKKIVLNAMPTHKSTIKSTIQSKCQKIKTVTLQPNF